MENMLIPDITMPSTVNGQMLQSSGGGATVVRFGGLCALAAT